MNKVEIKKLEGNYTLGGEIDVKINGISFNQICDLRFYASPGNLPSLDLGVNANDVDVSVGNCLVTLTVYTPKKAFRITGDIRTFEESEN